MSTKIVELPFETKLFFDGKRIIKYESNAFRLASLDGILAIEGTLRLVINHINNGVQINDEYKNAFKDTISQLLTW